MNPFKNFNNHKIIIIKRIIEVDLLGKSGWS